MARPARRYAGCRPVHDRAASYTTARTPAAMRCITPALGGCGGLYAPRMRNRAPTSPFASFWSAERTGSLPDTAFAHHAEHRSSRRSLPNPKAIGPREEQHGWLAQFVCTAQQLLF